MKKTILLCCLILSPILGIGQILVGPRIGGSLNYVSFAELKSKSTYGQNPYYGYQGGAVLNFIMSGNYSLHTELNYSRKGKKLNVDSKSILHVANYDYVEVPLLFRLSKKFHESGVGSYEGYINIGPNFNYWLGGKGYYTGGGLEDFGIEQQDYKITYQGLTGEPVVDVINIPDARRFQVGVDFGVGFIFDVLPMKKIMFDIRYHWGHTHLAQSNDFEHGSLFFDDDLKSANRSIMISVAYLVEIDLGQRNKGKSTVKSGKNKEKVGKKTNVPGSHKKKNKF